MSKLYTPLRVIEQLKKATDESGNDRIRMREDKLSARSLLNTVVNKPLNLDNFLSWTIGSTFCKQSYDGEYSDFNKRLLKFIQTQKKLSYKQARKQCFNSVTFTAIFSCWEQHKQAYRFDADFVDELMETNTVKVPVEVLLRLPFRCFYLDLEDVKRFDGILGLFVYVGFDEKTGLPNIGVICVKESENKDDDLLMRSSCFSGPDMLKTNVLYTDEEGKCCIRFTNNNTMLKNSLDISDFEVFDHYLFILQAMMYLCSNKPDTMESPKRKYVYLGKKKKTSVNGSNLVLTDVGVRYGTAIRKTKKQVQEVSNESEIIIVEKETARRSITSHIRSAHWHHYWVGKGKTQLIVKWIPPVFVSGSGKELPVTIHKVKK